MISEILKY